MNSCFKQISLLSLWSKNLGVTPKLNFGNSSKPASTTKCKPKSQKPGKKCEKKKKKAKAPAGTAATSPHGKANFMRTICLFGILPAIAGLSAFVFTHIEEHERPKFVPYEHMRLRNKRFPWGDGNKSFFHNPILNALPEGYEDEIALRQEEPKEEPENGMTNK